MADDFELTFDPSQILKLDRNLNTIANSAFREMAKDAVQVARDNIAPDKSGLHNRSGALAKSIRLANYVQMSPNGQGEATISAGNARVRYAAIQEKGGVITAKNAPYLVFQVNNTWVKTRSVRIPARPYLAPAGEQVISNYQTYLSEAFTRIRTGLPST